LMLLFLMYSFSALGTILYGGSKFSVIQNGSQ
jgi:hypothetical protein